MKSILFFSFVLWASSSFAENSVIAISERCPQQKSTEPVLYSSDLKWGYEIPEMMIRFHELYISPKRLSKRAYWDANSQQIKLPYFAERGGDIPVTETFVQTVARHIERAFEMDVVDAVFFPDMGHSHLLIPEQLMEKKYSQYPVNDFSGFYRDLFADPQLKILYHTAEQIKMLDDQQQLRTDARVQWRHKTRNIVGENNPASNLVYFQNPSSPVNTVHEVAGHYWWGGGYNLSSNQSGCFSYRKGNKNYFFDISMFDLEPSPDADWMGGD